MSVRLVVTDEERARIAREIAAELADRPPVATFRPVATDQTASEMLAVAHETFARWLGPEYDLEVIDAVMATAAAERLPGDPLWLLVISGSGNAKTETVTSLAGAGAVVTSTIASEGALLSGTPRKNKSQDATGGLLCRMGGSGVLVVKDVTSLLSMDRNTRAGVLAALREIHDQYWQRNLGVDGGRTLTWRGRIAVIGAVTTAWDRAHDVIAAMGDRFVTVRLDSAQAPGRRAAGERALANLGNESRMRQELATAVGHVLGQVDPDAAAPVGSEHHARLLAAADLVTLCRTAVDYDYRGDVIDSHAPEMPTRFAKQLLQVVRGAMAIGVDEARAVRLAIRCARDSMPPLRLAILNDVVANPGARTGDIRRRLDRPRATVDRQLQALHMLGVLTVDEVQLSDKKTSWLYYLADGNDPAALAFPDL